MKHRLRWILFGIAVLAILLLAARDILTSLTEGPRKEAVGRLKAALDEVRTEPARNVKTAQQTASPAVLAPVDDKDVRERWTRLFALARSRFGKDYSGNKALMLPLHVRWGKQKYNELTDPDRELLASLLADNKDILDETLALARPDMPVCRFNSFKGENGYRVLGNLLSAHVLYSAATEDYEVVVQIVLAQTRIWLADPYDSFPFRMGIGTMSILRDALESKSVSAEHWSELSDQLKLARSQDNFVQGWAAETAGLLEVYEDMPNSALKALDDRPLMRAGALAYTYVGTPLLNHNVTVFGDTMTRLLKIAPLPYYQARPELDRIREESGIPVPWELPIWEQEPSRYLIATMIHERIGGQSLVAAEVDLTRMAICLYRYRNETGAFPDTLSAIDEAFGGIPLNPMLGEPYLYERQGDGFKLWYRHKDDHGTHVRTWPDEWKLEPAAK